MFNGAPQWYYLLFPWSSGHGLGPDTSMWNGDGPSCLESGSSPWERLLGGHSEEANRSHQSRVSLTGSLPSQLPSLPHSLGTLTPKTPVSGKSESLISPLQRWISPKRPQSHHPLEDPGWWEMSEKRGRKAAVLRVEGHAKDSVVENGGIFRN